MNKIVKKEYKNRTVYTLDKKYHREDGPAREFTNGYKEWYLNGKLHREDGPAIEYASGSKEWYLHGKRHREDGPAVERITGYKEYWVNGDHLNFITNDQMLFYYLKYGFLK